MKICFLLLPALLSSSILHAQTDEPLNLKVTKEISREQISQFGYSGKPSQTNVQPIICREDALKFLELLNNNVDYGTFKTLIPAIIKELTFDGHCNYTVIVFRHSLNLDKLYKGNSDDRDKANTDYTAACERLKKLKGLLTIADRKFDVKSDLFNNNPLKVDSILNAAQLSEMNNLSSFKANLLDEKKQLENKMQASKDLFRKAAIEIVEEDKVESYILNKYDEDWDDYLLNRKNILLVFIGGLKDFTQASITINNKPSYLQANLNELYQVAQGAGLLKDAADENACNITETGLQKIPVSLVMLQSKKIKAPSEVDVSFKGKSDTVRFNIHERIKFSIKLGFSGAYLDRKNFSINDNNQLTITTDSAKKQELKSNLMAIFEWIPWGRDIDRLEPIWSKNKQIKIFDLQRFGIFGGAKLSSDPLQAILAGVSYSLSKEAALNFGIGFYATPKDVKDLPVGKDATLNYLRDNAEREYVPKLFIGISFSPKQIGKALGLIK